MKTVTRRRTDILEEREGYYHHPSSTFPHTNSHAA